MAKQTMFGEGKNAVQETGHIRSSKNSNGGQVTMRPVGGSPLNVAASTVSDRPQGAALTRDSPVPTSAEKPDLALTSKAAEAAHEDAKDHSFSSGGVMNR